MAAKVFLIPASADENPLSLSKKTEKIFHALCLDKRMESGSFVGLKIHFGEKGNTGYIRPAWLQGLVDRIRQKTSRVFLTDTNTLYLGNRSNSVDHLLLARDHGFSQETVGIPILIADGLIGRDSEEIAVDLPRIKSAKIAGLFLNTDFLVCLTHFTGHMLSGFGAALKNLGMGCASRAGKLEQHSDVHPWVKAKSCANCSVCMDYCPPAAIIQKEDKAFIVEEKCIGCGECLVVCPNGAVKLSWDGDIPRVQEKIAEYAFCVSKLFKEKIGFINFLVRITKDCDCMNQNGKVIAEDIGILASVDPVALDKASVDIVNVRAGKDIVRVHQNVDWSIQLKHAEKVGLGTMEYELIQLNDI